MCAQPRLLAALDEIRQAFGAWPPILAMHAEICARVTHIARGTDGPFFMDNFFGSAGRRRLRPPALFRPEAGPGQKPVFVGSVRSFVQLSVFHDPLIFPEPAPS